MDISAWLYVMDVNGTQIECTVHSIEAVAYVRYARAFFCIRSLLPLTYIQCISCTFMVVE